jgi:hypothetical protein
MLWSVPLGNAGAGLLLARPGGGCLMFSSRLLAAVDQRGDQLWAAPPGESGLGVPVVGPQSTVSRIEGDAIVVRGLGNGAVLATHPAARSSGLGVAPWGDLVFCTGAPSGVARLHCLARDGVPRWSVPLDGAAPQTYPPATMGDTVVVARVGALNGLDQDGRSAWTVPANGARLSGRPRQLGPTTVVLALDGDHGQVLSLLAGAPPALTRLADPNPVLAPFEAFPAPGSGGSAVDREWVLVGQAPVVQTSPTQQEYPLAALTLTAGGARPRWEHRLPARPRALLPVPGGTVVTLSPEIEHWDKYHPYHDLTTETFVRLVDHSGRERWTWHPQRPFTHFPVVDEQGTVFVGADDHLWAFSGR